MKIFKAKENRSQFVIWGEWPAPDEYGGIIPIAYGNGENNMGPKSITLQAYVDTDLYFLTVEPGEVIPPVIQGVGRITKFKDAGCRVRCFLI